MVKAEHEKIVPLTLHWGESDLEVISHPLKLTADSTDLSLAQSREAVEHDLQDWCTLPFLSPPPFSLHLPLLSSPLLQASQKPVTYAGTGRNDGVPLFSDVNVLTLWTS